MIVFCDGERERCCTLAIIELVKAGDGDHGKPFRPLPVDAITNDSTLDEVGQALSIVMEECWAEKDYARPSFELCIDLIYTLTGAE